mgnify:CR=1 FL=1
MIFLQHMNVIKPLPAKQQVSMNQMDFLLEGFWIISYEDGKYYGIEIGAMIGLHDFKI